MRAASCFVTNSSGTQQEALSDNLPRVLSYPHLLPVLRAAASRSCCGGGEIPALCCKVVAQVVVLRLLDRGGDLGEPLVLPRPLLSSMARVSTHCKLCPHGGKDP